MVGHDRRPDDTDPSLLLFFTSRGQEPGDTGYLIGRSISWTPHVPSMSYTCTMIIGKRAVHLHSMSVHFTSALYPVAVFFLFLSFFYRPDFSLFAYHHLMILATLSAPVSYLTGVAEWKQKYRGAKVRIFTRKKGAGVALVILGTFCTLWYVMYPGIMMDSGAMRAAFLCMNSSVVPLVVYLGSLGGKLVFGGAH